MRTLMTLGLATAALAAAPTPSPASHSQTLLICGSLSAYTQSQRPSSCFLDWPDLPLASASGLRRLAWTSWNHPTARGRAVTRTKTYDPWTPVTVRATGRRHCATIHGTGVYVYTRVRVDFGNGNIHTWRTPGCARLSGD